VLRPDFRTPPAAAGRWETGLRQPEKERGEVHMNETIRRQVMELLTSYRDNQRKIAVLRYELEHPAHITAEDMIESLAFRHGDGQGSAQGHISNKTMYIALNYREKLEGSNTETIDEIALRLTDLERRQQRIEHYVSLLEDRDAAIIRMTFFEGLTNERIADALKITTKTVTLHRTKGIRILCEMFAFTTGVQEGDNRN